MMTEKIWSTTIFKLIKKQQPVMPALYPKAATLSLETFQQCGMLTKNDSKGLLQYATQKGYYQPAAQAQPNQIQQVYSQLQGGSQQQQGQQQGMQGGQSMRM